MVELLACPPWLAADLWPHVRSMVCQSFERTDLGRASDLDTEVMSGRALLWIVQGDRIECALVTRLETTDRGRVCAILALGGRNAKAWRHLMPQIEEYAKAEDCHSVRWIGRRGWKRIFPDCREVGVVMERRING